MSDKIKVRVYHGGYGCESGCCGHYVVLTMPDETEREEFEFDHPDTSETDKWGEWAVRHAQRIVKNRWPECYDSIDWEHINTECVTDT